MDPKSLPDRRAELERVASRLAEVAALIEYIRFLKKMGTRTGWSHLLLRPTVYRDQKPV